MKYMKENYKTEEDLKVKIYKIKVGEGFYLELMILGVDGFTPKLTFDEDEAGWFEKDKAIAYKKIIEETISEANVQLIEVER